MNRRNVIDRLLGAMSIVTAGGGGATALAQDATGAFSYYPATLPRPPGAAEDFESLCINCYLCEEICLQRVRAIRVTKAKPRKTAS